jgi:hypothetical protein
VLGLFVPRQDQNNAARKTQAAKDWRQRDRFLAVRAYLQGAGINYLLAFRVGKAAVCQSNDADRDQNDPDDSSWFHLLRESLHAASARDQIKDQDDDCDDEQQVDESATNMTDEAEKPENQQNNKDSPEHEFSFRLSFLCFVRGATSARMDCP